MKSGLWFRPGNSPNVEPLLRFLGRVSALSAYTQEPVEVLFQHDLKRDKMAVAVLLPKKTLSGVSDTFNGAFNKACLDIRRYVQHVEKLRTEKKSDAGGKGRQGDRRSRPEGKRRNRLRQGRRSQEG